MKRKRKNEDARAALQLVLITICLSPAVPVAMSQVLEYEAIQHVLAQEPVQVEVAEIVSLRRGETPELLEYLFAEAAKYGANPEMMRQTIACESMHWVTDIQSWHRRPDGSREQSFGLAQIHLPDHPQVSYEEAINPHYAIKFMAQHFGENNGKIWTCFRDLFANSPSSV